MEYIVECTVLYVNSGFTICWCTSQCSADSNCLRRSKFCLSLSIQLVTSQYVALYTNRLNSSYLRSKQKLPSLLILCHLHLESPPNVSKLNNHCLPEAFFTITFVWFVHLPHNQTAVACVCIRFPWPQFVPLSTSILQLYLMASATNNWIVWVRSKIDTIWERKSSMESTSVRTLQNQISLEKQTSD